MNYTEVPRELIYKYKEHLVDFDIDKRYSLNGQLFILMRRYLFVELGRNDYRAILLMILNEAYYLTTMLLKDDNADENFEAYIKCVLKSSPYPGDINGIFRRLVFALSYIYLERPSVESLNVKTVRRHLRNHAFEFVFLNSEISEYAHPDTNEFKSVTLTEELLEQVNWKELTNNFRPESVKDFIDYLGDTKKEKRLLVKSMYLQLTTSGEMYSVPYSVDSILVSRYRQAGGKTMDLISFLKKEIGSIEGVDKLCFNKEFDIKLYDQMKQKSRIESVEKENRYLKQRNRQLEDELTNMKMRYEKQCAITLDQKEQRLREENLKVKIAEMNKIIDALQVKLGNKAIQLKYIVESIKSKADFAGLKEAYYLFEQIDLMLYEEPVWRENRSELVEFFRERNSHKAINVHIDQLAVGDNTIMNH